MGSGTVAEVALRNGRKVIGFEIKKEYCEYIIHRVNRFFDENAIIE
jgi:adenine-specific DNA-methyltransferase